jgi:hypothetical protein
MCCSLKSFHRLLLPLLLLSLNMKNAAPAPASKSQLGTPPINDPCSQVMAESTNPGAEMAAGVVRGAGVATPVVVEICPPAGVTATTCTGDGVGVGVGVTAGATVEVGCEAAGVTAGVAAGGV